MRADAYEHEPGVLQTSQSVCKRAVPSRRATLSFLCPPLHVAHVCSVGARGKGEGRHTGIHHVSRVAHPAQLALSFAPRRILPSSSSTQQQASDAASATHSQWPQPRGLLFQCLVADHGDTATTSRCCLSRGGSSRRPQIFIAKASTQVSRHPRRPPALVLFLGG